MGTRKNEPNVFALVVGDTKREVRVRFLQGEERQELDEQPDSVFLRVKNGSWREREMSWDDQEEEWFYRPAGDDYTVAFPAASTPYEMNFRLAWDDGTQATSPTVGARDWLRVYSAD